MSMFAKATRSAAKARIALAGPSGSGKTYTGLALACALAGRVAVVDTERGSASKYAGLNGWEFDTVAPQSFSPQSLVEILAAAGGEGYGCVLVDSLSHYWMGVGGMLEEVDRLTRQSRSGNSFSSGWKEARPDERRMVDALVSYPGHVVVTMRVKTEYIIEEDSRGKKMPRKIGLKPEQRDGLEYEFDVVGDLDLNNTLVVSKSRIPSLSGAVVRHPGAEFATTIRDWLSEGEEMPGPLAYRDQVLAADVTREGLLALHKTVAAAGLGNAVVTDEAGAATSLAALIVARGQSLAPKAVAPKAAPGSGPIDPKGALRREVEAALAAADLVGPGPLSSLVGRQVAHVKDLTTAEAQRVVAELAKTSETKESA